MRQHRVGTNRLEDLDAVHLRHHHVEQDDVGPFPAHELHGGNRLGRRDEVLVADTLEVFAHDLDVGRFVIDDGDLCRHGRTGGALAGIARMRGSPAWADCVRRADTKRLIYKINHRFT